jgi:hypothetical protein
MKSVINLWAEGEKLEIPASLFTLLSATSV